MKSQQPPSLLALSALLLCTLHQTAGTSSSTSTSTTTATSPSEVRGRNHSPQNWLKQTNVSSNHSHESRPSPKLKEVTGLDNSFSFNTSRGNISTVISERSGRANSWIPEDGVSPLCAYRVIEGGIGGQLCFRHTLFGYKCRKGDCRTVVSSGNLVANILTNGSVLLQWTHEGRSTTTGQDAKTKESATGDPGTSVFSGHRRHRRGGFELSCWWNGRWLWSAWGTVPPSSHSMIWCSSSTVRGAGSCSPPPAMTLGIPDPCA